MKGLQELRGALAGFLREHGLEAVTAWGPERRPRAGGPVAAVSLRGFESGPPGFQDYLGERYDEAKGGWEELWAGCVRRLRPGGAGGVGRFAGGPGRERAGGALPGGAYSGRDRLSEREWTVLLSGPGEILGLGGGGEQGGRGLPGL